MNHHYPHAIHFDVHGHCMSAHGTAADMKVASAFAHHHGVNWNDIETGGCRGGDTDCQQWRGMKVCGASDDDITNLWGGKGHDEAHVVVKHGVHTYCMQVTSPKIANDSNWRDHGDAWAKEHDATIEDGGCGAGWGAAVKSMDHGKTHVDIFMH